MGVYKQIYTTVCVNTSERSIDLICSRVIANKNNWYSNYTKIPRNHKHGYRKAKKRRGKERSTRSENISQRWRQNIELLYLEETE